MVIITDKKLKPRHENDLYITPYMLAYKMCELTNYENGNSYDNMKSVIDPGMGIGVFGRAMRDYSNDYEYLVIDGVDIKNQSLFPTNDFVYSNEYEEDYLNFKAPLRYNYAIGNPPYKLAEEFILKSLDITTDDGTIIFLLKLAFLEGKARCRGLFKKYPPSTVHVLAQRPSFDGSGKTNDYAFAVYVWNKQLIGRNRETRLKWMDWR